MTMDKNDLADIIDDSAYMVVLATNELLIKPGTYWITNRNLGWPVNLGDTFSIKNIDTNEEQVVDFNRFAEHMPSRDFNVYIGDLLLSYELWES